ncbi:MAG: cupredoxin family copper-binding protein [Coriobacteriia bacterium]
MTLRIRMLVLAAAVVVLATLVGCTGAKSGSGGSSVSIKGFAFEPASLKVAKGSTVVWTNNDSVDHTIIGEGFNSGQIAPSSTFRYKFDKAGTYDYSCGIHPSMKGQVIVE